MAEGAQRVAYVDGGYVPEERARVSVFDRGFLFADAVYEVVAVVDRAFVDLDYHLERLERSLGVVRISLPRPTEELAQVLAETAARNRIVEGWVYLQVSRGAAERAFPFPEGAAPTVVAFARQGVLTQAPAAERGLRVCTAPDQRWARRDVKTVMLLPAALAKQAALEQGFDDAWLVQDGSVTEGTSSTAYIVRANTVITHPLSTAILPGCTRRRVLELARDAGVAVEERPFSPEEARGAEEAFITSATTLVTPVVEIDGRPVGTGRPGPLTLRLRELFLQHARASAVPLWSPSPD